MIKSELIEAAKPLFKARGYKKKSSTWIKECSEIALVINVQGSQFDKDSYYINLGVYIKALGKKELPTTIIDCQLMQRVDSITDGDMLAAVSDKWEQWYGSMDKLYEKAVSGKLPDFSHRQVYAYLIGRGRSQK